MSEVSEQLTAGRSAATTEGRRARPSVRFSLSTRVRVVRDWLRAAGPGYVII